MGRISFGFSTLDSEISDWLSELVQDRLQACCVTLFQSVSWGIPGDVLFCSLKMFSIANVGKTFFSFSSSFFAMSNPMLLLGIVFPLASKERPPANNPLQTPGLQ